MFSQLSFKLVVPGVVLGGGLGLLSLVLFESDSAFLLLMYVLFVVLTQAVVANF